MPRLPGLCVKLSVNHQKISDLSTGLTRSGGRGGFGAACHKQDGGFLAIPQAPKDGFISERNPEGDGDDSQLVDTRSVA